MSAATRRILEAISWAACLGTILPSLLYLAGRLPLDAMQGGMLVATLVWFVVTPCWMGRAR